MHPSAKNQNKLFPKVVRSTGLSHSTTVDHKCNQLTTALEEDSMPSKSASMLLLNKTSVDSNKEQTKTTTEGLENFKKSLKSVAATETENRLKGFLQPRNCKIM